MSDALSVCQNCGLTVHLDDAHYIDWRTFHPSCCPHCRQPHPVRHRRGHP